MKRPSIDFKQLKEDIRIEDLINYFGLEFKSRKHYQLQGNCPFPDHGGNRNSLSFGIDTEKDIYNCPTHCGSGVGCIDFYCAMKSLDRNREAYKAALELQSIFKNGAPVRKSIANTTQNQPTEVNPIKNIHLTIDSLVPYLLEEKKLSEKTLQYFGVGKAKYGVFKDHIVIPIHNSKGERLGYVGQNLDIAKWKFYFNKSLELFNFHRIYKPNQKLNYVILVEGFYSTMYLHQEGFRNVVACMGVFPSKQQIELLSKLTDKVIVFFDNDKAGKEGQAALQEKKLPFQVQYAKYPTNTHGFKPNTLPKEAINESLGEALHLFS